MLAAAIWATPVGGGLLLAPVAAAQQTLTAHERAQAILTIAKAAFNDGNYTVAADRFREYLRIASAGRLEMAAARYGLGVSIIESQRDYRAATDVLVYAAQTKGFRDQGLAAYYLGVAQRGWIEQAKLEAAKPADPGARKPPQRPSDEILLRNAGQNFALAADLLAERAAADKITVAPDAKELPADLEWVARARCDQAEVLLRVGRYKEAWVAADRVANDPQFALSRYRAAGQYYLGYAAFGLKDWPVAVRALASLAPFDQDGIGVHAQCLLARVHHLAGERPEAMAGYQSMVAEWERQRRDAAARAADPQTPAAEKERLTAAAKEPAPEYVARAMFYWGVALTEFGQPDEALPKFLRSVELAGSAPVAGEARLRAGIAGVQARKYGPAIAALEPVVGDEKSADQALRWLAKAQYGLGTVPVPLGRGAAAIANAAPDPVALAAGIRKAVDTLKLADEKARAMAATDPSAQARRATILLELGDMLQLDRRYADAATVYAAIRQVSAMAQTEAAEQGLLRQAIALQLAGNYAESDNACAAFSSNHPRSVHRPEAAVRYAENALLAASAAKNPAAANSDGSKRPYGEAVARFERVLSKYADSPQANVARFGLATIQYLQGQYGPAADALNKIPDGDRIDDLVGVNLMLADCKLRALPETAEDALSGARLANQLEQVLTMLDGFVASRAKDDPEVADANVRIGHAATRLAKLLAEPAERRRTLARARRAYSAVAVNQPDHPLYPVAALEGAKLMAAFGSGNAAALELSKFRAEDLAKLKIAPLALIHLADAARTQRKPDDAAGVLREVRAKYEAELLADPDRAAWVPTMQYSLALSLKEGGKYAEARELLAKIAAENPKRPEAVEATWRVAQCAMDPAMADVEGRRRALSAAVKPETQAEVLAGLLEATKALRTAGEHMGAEAAKLAEREPESEVPQRMYYDAAWCWRIVGEVEVEAARRQMQTEALRKMVEKLQAEDPTRTVAGLQPPAVPLSAIPLQAGEKLARERYKAVIDGNVADSALVDEARVELGDLLASRDEFDAAIATLGEAVAKATNADLGDRLRVRMASLQLGKGDAKGALATVNEIITAQRNVYAGYAHLIATEAAFQVGEWQTVVEKARLFVDPRPYGRLPGVSDHALLRMAHAQQKLGQWAESKATLEDFLTRFNNSSLLLNEAKYAAAMSAEQLKEFDRAAALYQEVAARTAGELGAKANYRAGLVRLGQQKYAEAIGPLMTVAYGYDDPELSPAAMCEGARALDGMGKREEARRLLTRVTRDYPTGKWAAEAKGRLEALR
ncbi:MAG: tetratricopeptide repeat protein [Phycisphaerae bacterium]